MKVYLVSAGAYHYYRITAVCSDRCKAEQLQRITDRKNEVEEVELDAPVNHPSGVPFLVVMDIDGDHHVRPTDTEEKGETPDCGRSPHEFKGISPREFMVWADDEADAVKKIDARRLAMIELGFWKV